MQILFRVESLSPVFAQTGTPPASAPVQANQDKPPANAAGRSRDRSLLKPKPGSEAIKPKDYSDASGYWHPFARIGQYTLMDQKAIWTNPFHTSKKDAKWWLIFGGATGGLIAADKYVSKNAPNPRCLDHLGNDISYLGEPYTLLPIAAGF